MTKTWKTMNVREDKNSPTKPGRQHRVPIGKNQGRKTSGKNVDDTLTSIFLRINFL